jgi:hypothetical protein
MALALEILDEETRHYMLAELDRDEKVSGGAYISERLSPQGVAVYPSALREAIAVGMTRQICSMTSAAIWARSQPSFPMSILVSACG